MKVYVTKYAITRGVFLADVEETDNPELVKFEKWTYLHRNEWFKQESLAKANARERLNRKLQSLRIQSGKVQRMLDSI